MAELVAAAVSAAVRAGAPRRTVAAVAGAAVSAALQAAGPRTAGAEQRGGAQRPPRKRGRRGRRQRSEQAAAEAEGSTGQGQQHPSRGTLQELRPSPFAADAPDRAHLPTLAASRPLQLERGRPLRYPIARSDSSSASTGRSWKSRTPVPSQGEDLDQLVCQRSTASAALSTVCANLRARGGEEGQAGKRKRGEATATEETRSSAERIILWGRRLRPHYS